MKIEGVIILLLVLSLNGRVKVNFVFLNGIVYFFFNIFLISIDAAPY